MNALRPSPPARSEYAGPRWGFIDPEGAWVIPPRFEAARRFVGGRAAARADGLWGLIGPSGAWIVAPRFRELCDPGPTLTCAREASGAWGYIDADGAWAVAPAWDGALPFGDGVGPIARKVGVIPGMFGKTPDRDLLHWGFVDATGREILSPAPAGDPSAWTGAGEPSEGLIAIRTGERWGYVDPSGAWVIAPEYIGAKPFRGGFAAVAGGRWGVIDRSGAVVVSGGHGLADGASEGRLSGPDGYYDLAGQPVGPRWDWVRPLADGAGAAQQDGLWTLLDADGEARFPPRFDRLTDPRGGRALAATRVENAFVWGLVGLDGAWIVEPRWPAVDERGFSEGMAAVASP